MALGWSCQKINPAVSKHCPGTTNLEQQGLKNLNRLLVGVTPRRVTLDVRCGVFPYDDFWCLAIRLVVILAKVLASNL